MGGVIIENNFFKPTLVYKEYLILDLIEKNKSITQRQISNIIGVAVSRVNNYLDEYEKSGFIKRIKYTKKTVDYILTKRGQERKKILNIRYLKSSKRVYLSVGKKVLKIL